MLQSETATHTLCETRIHQEYKYKLSDFLQWAAEATQAKNPIARIDSFGFCWQDWSSYWVPAPFHNANADFQSQKRRIHTQQLAAAAIATTTHYFSFFISSTNLGLPPGRSCSRRPIMLSANRRQTPKIPLSGFEPDTKRLARRFSLKGYLEPKWLRWQYLPSVKEHRSHSNTIKKK